MTSTELPNNVPNSLPLAEPTLPPQAPASANNPNISPIILGVVIGILITASSAFAFFLGQKTSSVPTSVPTQSNLPTSAPTSSNTNSDTPDLSSLTWQSPKQVPNFKIFVPKTDDSSYVFDQAKTFLVASAKDGSKLYNLLLSYEGPGNPIIIRLVQKNSKIYYADRLIDTYTQESINKNKLFTVQVEALSQDIPDLQVPDTITLSNGQIMSVFAQSYIGKQFESELAKPVLFENHKFGKILIDYEGVNAINVTNVSSINVRIIYLSLKDTSLIAVKPKYDFSKDDKAISIAWADGDGKVSTVNYQDIVYAKCGGSSGSSIVKNNDTSGVLTDKKLIGSVTNSGKSSAVYSSVNPSSPLLKLMYEQYKMGREYPSAAPVLSYEQFINQKTHFLFQDMFGDWTIYVNQEYAPMVECGKPVVYLYPTVPTKINVQVGAQISKSDPDYPANGWTVLAAPNGQLTYQNQNYPNLFWEGQGNGVYPNLSNYGVVVAQKDLIDTLTSQLSLLGLNTQESADFMEFWQPKLPTTPYVRLTWLGTKDMDNLAPLTVDPSPDTRIRIFLEFEGLTKPVKLIPQKLTAPKRSGFTLVEWGGLLIQNQ